MICSLFNKWLEFYYLFVSILSQVGGPSFLCLYRYRWGEASSTWLMCAFMQVVRSSAHHEAAAMMPWPRSAWTSSYPSRLARIPFPRGIVGGAFRGRLPIKPGARSLQWKREAPTNPTTDTGKNLQNTQLSGNSLPSPTARSLTYVRSGPKSDANSTPV